MRDFRDDLADWFDPTTGYDAADRLVAHLRSLGYDTEGFQPNPGFPTPAVGVLRRDEDVTGLSGTGVVAWVAVFPDGVCVTRWCVSAIRQTAVFASTEDVMAIHGHDGRTRFEWFGAFPNDIWPER